MPRWSDSASDTSSVFSDSQPPSYHTSDPSNRRPPLYQTPAQHYPGVYGSIPNQTSARIPTSLPVNVSLHSSLLVARVQKRSDSVLRAVKCILWVAIGAVLALHVLHFSAIWPFVDPGSSAYWMNVTASPICSSIGAREYTGVLSYMPEGFHPSRACKSVPLIIHGRRIASPLSCWSEAFQHEEQVVDKNGNRINQTTTRTITKARWLIDFDEPACIPSWDPVAPGLPSPIPDQYCHEYGTRIYTAFMTVSRVPPGLNALASCHHTPAVIHGIERYPSQCLSEIGDHGEPIIRAQVLVEENSCTAVWSNVRPDYQCTQYGVKRYTGLLDSIPSEFDGLKICWEVPYAFFGQRKKPDSCEKVMADGTERIMGSWFIDRNVPECHPILKDVKDKGCAGSTMRRIEAQVVDIGKHEDWYRMCTTTPLYWRGRQYLPTQCESRTIWFINYKVALFDVLDSFCS